MDVFPIEAVKPLTAILSINGLLISATSNRDQPGNGATIYSGLYTCPASVLLRFSGRRSRISAGFSLIEVLTTLFITAIGFLGVAGMQSLSLQGTQQSYFTTRANLLLHDMALRMYGNPVAALNGDYLHEGINAAADSAACHGATEQCSTRQMAAADIAQWGQEIALTSGLPGGKSSIVALPAEGTFLLTVSWLDSRANRHYDMVQNPTCEDEEDIGRSCLSVMVYIRE